MLMRSEEQILPAWAGAALRKSMPRPLLNTAPMVAGCFAGSRAAREPCSTDRRSGRPADRARNRTRGLPTHSNNRAPVRSNRSHCRRNYHSHSHTGRRACNRSRRPNRSSSRRRRLRNNGSNAGTGRSFGICATGNRCSHCHRRWTGNRRTARSTGMEPGRSNRNRVRRFGNRPAGKGLGNRRSSWRPTARAQEVSDSWISPLRSLGHGRTAGARCGGVLKIDIGGIIGRIQQIGRGEGAEVQGLGSGKESNGNECSGLNPARFFAAHRSPHAR